MILMIDELAYLTEHDSGFACDLQKAWDRSLDGMPVLLICVGSDVRMMDELVKERSPLHGRPTPELAVRPLSVSAIAEITKARDSSEAIDRYLIVGGFPLLAARWPSGASIEQFLHRLWWTTTLREHGAADRRASDPKQPGTAAS